jgi:hypothetical protein
MKKHEIQNNVFGGIEAESLKKIKDNAIPDSRVRLWATMKTPSMELVPTAEALVAYDPRTDTIVKFISAFVPPPRDKSHKGIKYLISADKETGLHRPVVIAWDGQKKEGQFWNPKFLTAFLDYGKLPVNNENAEFRILRAYRAGIRAPSRFELLKFEMPKPGQDVDRENAMWVEAPFNSVPPIQLARCYKPFFWWQKQIVHEIGIFAGVDLRTALGLGIKRKLDQAVQQGNMSEQVKEDILHDHSEDPVEEVKESIAESFGVGGGMVKAEEGQDFYVPANPMLKTTPDREEEEETVELFD